MIVCKVNHRCFADKHPNFYILVILKHQLSTHSVLLNASTSAFTHKNLLRRWPSSNIVKLMYIDRCQNCPTPNTIRYSRMVTSTSSITTVRSSISSGPGTSDIIIMVRWWTWAVGTPTVIITLHIVHQISRAPAPGQSTQHLRPHRKQERAVGS